MLLTKFHVSHYTNRQVGICFQHLDTFIAYQHRSVMSCVAVVQFASSQIQHAHKHGNKHVILILPFQDTIDAVHYLCGFINMSRSHAEQCLCRCHKQRCRHTLTAYVANAEEQLLITDKVIVKVTAYLLGRLQEAIHVNVLTLCIRSSFLRQHGHLYVTGNAQLAKQTRLAGSCLLQLCHIIGKRMLHLHERVTQRAHLILQAQRRQLRQEITVCHVLRRFRQRLQRQQLRSNDIKQTKRYEQQQQYQDKDHVLPQLVSLLHDLIFRDTETN